MRIHVLVYLTVADILLLLPDIIAVRQFLVRYCVLHRLSHFPLTKILFS